MYALTTRSRRAEKQLRTLIKRFPLAKDKILLIQKNPRTATGAHKLRRKLEGKWSCVIASDGRIVYDTDDENNQLIIVAAGNHKHAYS